MLRANFYYPQGPLVGSNGFITLEWQQFLQNPQFVSLTNTPITGFQSLFPPKDDGASQTDVSLTAGLGAPDDLNGEDGWFYFRGDGGVGTSIYLKSSGVWTGIV